MITSNDRIFSSIQIFFFPFRIFFFISGELYLETKKKMIYLEIERGIISLFPSHFISLVTM